MISMSLTVQVAGGRSGEVVRTLRQLTGPVRVQEGCLGCRILQDLERPGCFVLEVEWEGREELDRHLRSADFRKILAIMECSSTAPELRFLAAWGIGGQEVVAVALGSSTRVPGEVRSGQTSEAEGR